jgi:16S rRNA (guanine966-N2)-methyltransferase
MRIAAGRFKGRALPEAREARPAGARWKGSLFGVLGPYLEGARVLDLFAGVGGLGLEALSRGAAHVTLVENDARAALALERWIADVGAGASADVQRRDATRSVPRGPFDIAFADPPFSLWDGPEGEALVRRSLASVPEGVLVLKLPSRRDVPSSPAWTVVRRRAVGSVQWAILRAAEGRESGVREPPAPPPE